jgi:hypothetical protein
MDDLAHRLPVPAGEKTPVGSRLFDVLAQLLGTGLR